MKRRFPFTVALLALVWPAQVVKAAPGIDRPFLKTVSEKTWGDHLADAVGFGGFSKSYALVIGISDYAGGYDDLPTGNDAKRMADYLIEEAGFDYVHLLTEDKVTKGRVAELMSDEFPDLLDENDRFFFYWSGHGDTRAIATGDGKAGFLALSDTPVRKWSRMIAMEDVQRWNRFLPAQQSLFLLDACFSGLAGFVQQSSTPRDWKIEQLSQPSHHVMSAGTENEKTIAGDRWGGSLFTTAVLDGLRGAADAASGFDKDDIISLTELKAYVQDRVLFERRAIGYESQITPQVRDLRHNAGEFFFLSSHAVKIARVDPSPSLRDESTVDKSGEATTLSPPQLSPEQIEASLALDEAAVQRALATLGQNPGAADGVLGQRSRGALRSWQSANGFDPTGYLTAEQYQKLLRDAEQRLAQVPAVVEPPATDPSLTEPAVGLPSYEPLTTFRDCPNCPEMVVIPEGAFFMGSREAEPDSRDDERPRHRVNVESFAIGKYEVTFDEWDACVDAGGCNHQPEDQGWGRSNRPIIDVSWQDAQQYAIWLSRETGQSYRLPSEAEWEYAARAGTTTRYFWGNEADSGCIFANGRDVTSRREDLLFWEKSFSCDDGYAQTALVGTFRANAFGLFDISGNVSEWVEDRWHANYEGAPTDGSSWTDGNASARVLRGGSWIGSPSDLRSAGRLRSQLSIRSASNGFRVARTLTP